MFKMAMEWYGHILQPILWDHGHIRPKGGRKTLKDNIGTTLWPAFKPNDITKVIHNKL